jgi:hypothetical protein
MYYKKNVTKLSIIYNSNKIPLTITPFKSTTNVSKTIIVSIKFLNNNKKINLIGDKGYLSKKINKIIFLKRFKGLINSSKKEKSKYPD